MFDTDKQVHGAVDVGLANNPDCAVKDGKSDERRKSVEFRFTVMTKKKNGCAGHAVKKGMVPRQFESVLQIWALNDNRCCWGW